MLNAIKVCAVPSNLRSATSTNSDSRTLRLPSLEFSIANSAMARSAIALARESVAFLAASHEQPCPTPATRRPVGVLGFASDFFATNEREIAFTNWMQAHRPTCYGMSLRFGMMDEAANLAERLIRSIPALPGFSWSGTPQRWRWRTSGGRW